MRSSNPSRDAWVISYTSVDPSQDGIVAFANREEAVDAAVDFIKGELEYELTNYDAESDESGELGEALKEIKAALAAGNKDEAIISWLYFQEEYDPPEKISIGPSGAVSASPSDFEPSTPTKENPSGGYDDNFDVHGAPIFDLGRVVMTRGVAEAFPDSTKLLSLVRRHVHGDWGEIGREDADENRRALKAGGQLMSVYTVDGVKIWVITEGDRSVTTVLLPEEY